MNKSYSHVFAVLLLSYIYLNDKSFMTEITIITSHNKSNLQDMISKVIGSLCKCLLDC